MFQSRLEKSERAHNIGLNKRRGPKDGAVHMAFRREMNDRIGLMHGQQATHEFAVKNRPVNELVRGIAAERGQVIDVAGVSERIEVDDPVTTAYSFEHKVGADETSASGHQQDLPMHVSLSVLVSF